jgi:hypothetical protein
VFLSDDFTHPSSILQFTAAAERRGIKPDRLAPNKNELWYRGRGMVCFMMEDLTKAREGANKALELNQNDAETLYMRFILELLESES